MLTDGGKFLRKLRIDNGELPVPAYRILSSALGRVAKQCAFSVRTAKFGTGLSGKGGEENFR